ncbi:hypothetical protein F5B18DRAFT_656266 [Nemania serpens]|nr:hypothetical protein F5B18DRAFT_656266 [Nemania serpens]
MDGAVGTALLTVFSAGFLALFPVLARPYIPGAPPLREQARACSAVPRCLASTASVNDFDLDEVMDASEDSADGGPRSLSISLSGAEI